MAKGPDTQGAPAADHPKDLSKGEQAEKGDAHRPYRQHQGKTRGGTVHDQQSNSQDQGDTQESSE
jgi:hypothetical protein